MTHEKMTPAPRLIALDMDGTLLDGAGAIPDEFWDLLDRAHQQGVTLAPASGRQLATLRDMFDGHETSPRSYIAENGTVVYHDGEVIDTTPIARHDVHRLLKAAQRIEVPHAVVLCGPERAFCLRGPSDKERAEMEKYYHALEEVDDLEAVADSETITKTATLCFDGTEEHIAPIYKDALSHLNVAVSGKVWIDTMDDGANKGIALKQLAEKLGLENSQTAAFGDYLNDYELLLAAGTPIAMENGHGKLKDIAKRIAPPNTEHGVIQVLKEWLD